MQILVPLNLADVGRYTYTTNQHSTNTQSTPCIRPVLTGFGASLLLLIGLLCEDLSDSCSYDPSEDPISSIRTKSCSEFNYYRMVYILDAQPQLLTPCRLSVFGYFNLHNQQLNSDHTIRIRDSSVACRPPLADAIYIPNSLFQAILPSFRTCLLQVVGFTVKKDRWASNPELMYSV